MVECLHAVLESVRDARAQMARHRANELLAHVLAHDVAAEWKGKTGFLKPPLAHVGDEMQSAVAEGELSLVDEQAGVDFTVHDGILDLIEGGHHRFEVGLVELHREIRGGERARDRYPLASDIGLGHWRARDEARAIAVAHR